MQTQILEIKSKILPLATEQDPGELRLSDYDLDGLVPPDRALTPAGVLVGVMNVENRPAILLTERPEHLTAHGGQIAFPGGKREPHDHTLVMTACRETEEETGLSRQQIEPIGQLPLYQTVTGFLITPIVAQLHPPYLFQPDCQEVSDLFHVPLEFFRQSENFKRQSLIYKGKKRHYWTCPYRDRTTNDNLAKDVPDVDEQRLRSVLPPARSYTGERFIWGATAAILKSMHDLLNETLAQ